MDFMGLSVLLTKSEVFCYRIPKRIQKKEQYIHRASDWDLPKPIGNYRLTLNATRGYLYIELINEDIEGQRSSGVVGQSLPICNYPDPVFQLVIDSSRYFTLRLNCQSAVTFATSDYPRSIDNNDYELIGIGFTHREDSSDLFHAIKNFFASHNQSQSHPQMCSNQQLNEFQFQLSINQETRDNQNRPEIDESMDFEEGNEAPCMSFNFQV